MTWSHFDDVAPTHPKASVAGNDAWALWMGAIIYSNKYLTDGFVTVVVLATKCLPVPIPLKTAEKLAEKLCAAVIKPGGKGLFERVEGGYVIHDFLEWNPSKEEVEAKRKADRARKKGPKDSGGNPSGEGGGVPRDSGRNPNGSRGGSRAESERSPTLARTGARTPTPAGAHSLPTHTNPTQPTKPPAEAGAGADPDSTEDRTTVCPLNLPERLETHGALQVIAEKTGASLADIRKCVGDFVAYWTIGAGMGQRRSGWAAKARQWVLDQHGQGKLVGLAGGEPERQSGTMSTAARERLERRQREREAQHAREHAKARERGVVPPAAGIAELTRGIGG